MRHIVRARIRTLLAQQSGHTQLLIFAPILTLFLLSLVVRTANSAIDPTLEKKKITYQLKQRLIEVRNAEGTQPTLTARTGSEPQSRAKNPKVAAFQASSPREDATSAVALHCGEGSPSSEKISAEVWVAAENHANFDLLLTSATSAPVTAPSQSENEKKSPSAIAQLSATTQWQVAKGKTQPISLAPVGVATRSKKKENQPQAVAKVPDLEEVKKALESSAPKKPAPVRTAAVAPVPLPAPVLPQKEAPSIPQPEYLSIKIKRDDTLEKILKRTGVSAKETAQWTKAAQKLTEFRTLRPGQILELFFAQDVDSPGLKTLTYIPEEDVHLFLERKTQKRIEATRILPPTQQVWLVVGGRIEKSFSKSLKKTGLPEQLVKAVKGLAWDIDLSDLRSGDPFKVLVEARQRGQKIVEYKTVLAAELSNHGETFTAFLLPEERENLSKKKFAEQYRGQGLKIESGGEKFLPFPLRFSRISSSFSGARLHPILHRTRRHNGIDFAAPRGTPVYSVAKGVVTFVGRQSGYGNIVKIDHPGPYETAYAHLQGFAAGLEEGAEIEQGHVVGYVGSTGLATGPHLHFELLKDGLFVNPFIEHEEVMVASAPEDEPAPVDPVIEAKKKSLVEKMAALTIERKSFTSLVIPQQSGAIASATRDRQGDGRQQASSGE